MRGIERNNHSKPKHTHILRRTFKKKNLCCQRYKAFVAEVSLLSQKSSNMNTTVNGSSCSFLPNSTAVKIGKTFAYCLIFAVSLVGNSFIGIIVCKTPALRKPINYFIVNLAMSDLLFPIFLLPWDLADLYMDSQWLVISGPLGQALCKLVSILTDVSSFVSIQSLILIAVDRFGAVVFPLRSPLISSKLCPFFILAT